MKTKIKRNLTYVLLIPLVILILLIIYLIKVNTVNNSRLLELEKQLEKKGVNINNKSSDKKPIPIIIELDEYETDNQIEVRQQKLYEINQLEEQIKALLEVQQIQLALVSDTVESMNKCIADLEKGLQRIEVCEILVNYVKELNEETDKQTEKISQLKLQKSILEAGL